MKIGICGGTFDPFHRGHLEPVRAVRDRMQWDRVLYVPAYIQPFKQDRDYASAYHRFAMTAIATFDDETLFVSPMELERGRVSYSVETLEDLRTSHPEATLDWVIGDDNLEKLLEWKSIERIFELANFAVLSRGGHDVPPSLAARIVEPHDRATHGAIVFADNATVPVSSTEIRLRLRNSESIEDLVPPSISRYIHHNGLYRKGQQ